METVIFDMKDSQGSAKHRLVFVLKNRKNNEKKTKKLITFHRWTNIPEQNFNPQLENVINNDHITSISSHPLSREPFFIKYPWILEDIVVKTFDFKFL